MSTPKPSITAVCIASDIQIALAAHGPTIADAFDAMVSIIDARLRRMANVTADQIIDQIAAWADYFDQNTATSEQERADNKRALEAVLAWIIERCE